GKLKQPPVQAHDKSYEIRRHLSLPAPGPAHGLRSTRCGLRRERGIPVRRPRGPLTHRPWRSWRAWRVSSPIFGKTGAGGDERIEAITEIESRHAPEYPAWLP